MHWVAPTEKDTATGNLEKRLWDASDQFRTNSGLKSQEYSTPIFGLIFLRFAEARFEYMLNRPEAENIGAKVNAANYCAIFAEGEMRRSKQMRIAEFGPPSVALGCRMGLRSWRNGGRAELLLGQPARQRSPTVRFRRRSATIQGPWSAEFGMRRAACRILWSGGCGFFRHAQIN
jgi:hypothetical protein